MAALSIADFGPGAVVTLMIDITGVTPGWAEMSPGTHLVVLRPTYSGSHVEVLNTRTGRTDFLPLYEAWLLAGVRLIALAPVAACEFVRMARWHLGVRTVAETEIGDRYARGGCPINDYGKDLDGRSRSMPY